jgi:hypothetical protein
MSAPISQIAKFAVVSGIKFPNRYLPFVHCIGTLMRTSFHDRRPYLSRHYCASDIDTGRDQAWLEVAIGAPPFGVSSFDYRFDIYQMRLKRGQRAF